MTEGNFTVQKLLRLALYTAHGQLTPLDGVDGRVVLEFALQSDAQRFVANLMNIINCSVDEIPSKVSLRGNNVAISNSFNDYEDEQLDLSVHLAEYLSIMLLLSRSGKEINLSDAGGIPDFAFVRRSGRLYLESDAEHKTNISYVGLSSDNIINNLQNPAFNARFEVSEESLNKLQDMICFLIASGQVVTAFSEKNFGRLLLRCRNLASIARLLWSCSNIEYFKEFDVKIGYSGRDGSSLDGNVISIKVQEHGHALLISSFLLNSLMLDVPDTCQETEDGYIVEFSDSVIQSNLAVLETLPCHYDCYYRVIEALSAIRGVSRIKLTNNEIRVRCDRKSFDQLRGFSSSYVLNRENSAEGRIYSNRIYFNPLELYSEIEKLEDISGRTGTSQRTAAVHKSA